MKERMQQISRVLLMITKFREKCMEAATDNTEEKCGGWESGVVEKGRVAMHKKKSYLSTQFSKKLEPTAKDQNVIYLYYVENPKGR